MRTLSLILIGVVLLPVSSLGQGWENGPSLNAARFGLGAVQCDGHIYVAGGQRTTNTLEVLYSGDTQWRRLASLPAGQRNLCAALVGDRIYTLGGYGPSDICQIYDISENRWHTGPTLPTALYWATAQAVGNRIYLMGGWQPGGAGRLDTLWILDTDSGTWTKGASLPSPVQDPASAVHANQIFVFSNVGCFKYSVQDDRWSAFSGPPSGHGYSVRAVTAGDRIYLMGGSPGNIGVAYPTTEVFDPIAETWTSAPYLNVARYSFQAVYVDQEETIYAMGGRGLEAVTLASVEKLSTATEATFTRGNVNGDDAVDIADALFILGYLYAGSSPASCLDAADTNDDGRIDISDAISLLWYMFGSGESLPPPFTSCGSDETEDELSCLEFEGCP